MIDFCNYDNLMSESEANLCKRLYYYIILIKVKQVKQLLQFLEKLNVKVIIVKTSDLMSPLGYILGGEGFERGTEL